MNPRPTKEKKYPLRGLAQSCCVGTYSTEDSDVLKSFLPGFPHFLQPNSGIVSRLGTIDPFQILQNSSFVNHHITQLCIVEILKASWNKQQKRNFYLCFFQDSFQFTQTTRWKDTSLPKILPFWYPSSSFSFLDVFQYLAEPSCSRSPYRSICFEV
jgi:hypothetical protein